MRNRRWAVATIGLGVLLASGGYAIQNGEPARTRTKVSGEHRLDESLLPRPGYQDPNGSGLSLREILTAEWWDLTPGSMPCVGVSFLAASWVHINDSNPVKAIGSDVWAAAFSVEPSDQIRRFYVRALFIEDGAAEAMKAEHVRAIEIEPGESGVVVKLGGWPGSDQAEHIGTNVLLQVMESAR